MATTAKRNDYQNKPTVYINFPKYNLWAPVPDSQDRANLAWSTANDNPRLMVFLSKEDRKKNLYVGFDQVSFFNAIAVAKSVFKAPNANKQKIVNYGKDQEGNQIINNTLVFGKEESGQCWILIHKEGAPVVQFKLTPSIWHKFSDSTGNEVVAKIMYETTALKYIELLELTMQHAVAVANYKNRADEGIGAINPADGGASAGVKPAASSFDDIPY